MKQIKVYTPVTTPITQALIGILTGFKEGVGATENADDADIVLVTSFEELRKAYNRNHAFILVSHDPLNHDVRQPDNVFVAKCAGPGVSNALHTTFEALNNALRWKSNAKPQAVKQFAMPTILPGFSKSWRVLVIDDTSTNLERAMQLLVGQQIVLAKGPEEAMRYLNLKGETFDAVLTDLNMLPDRAYPALNLDRYGVGETIPNGFAIVFEATARGIPVAVVTDGNHHQDWTVAMFSRVTGATVNGQKVLFRNDPHKRWDTALHALLEQ